MADFNNWNKIAEALPDELAAMVKETGIAGKANIQGEINRNGQVRTGAMRDNVYWVTQDESTYGQGRAPESGSRLPEIPRPSSRFEVRIGIAVSYWVFPNYGTRYQPARPFFEPGMQQTRPFFEQRLSQLEQKLKERL